MSGDAAEGAADTAAGSAAAGAATTMKMYRETATRLQPWVSVGGDALKRLSVLTGLTRSASGANLDGEFDEGGGGRFVRRDLPGYTGPRDQFSGQGTEWYDTLSGMSGQGPSDLIPRVRKWDDEQGPEDEGYGDLLKEFSLADFEADPGYAFRKEEGEKALTRGAAARGMAMSTPGLKDLMRFNQGLASQEYGAAYTRDAAGKQRTFDYLSYLSGSGQNAAAQVGVSGTNAAAASAALTAQAGQIAGQGQINSAALTSNGITSGVGNYMYQKRYDDMMDRMDTYNSVLGSRLPASSGTFGIGAGA